jgi:hypothetical protein
VTAIWLAATTGYDWLALYGAIIATCALFWQVATWVLERQPKLEVALFRKEFWSHRVDGLMGGELLVIEVRNCGGKPAYITSVGIAAPDYLNYQTSLGGYEGATLPGTIEPGDRGIIMKVISAGEQDKHPPFVDSDQRLFAYAWTATGRKLETEPIRLADVPKVRDELADLPEPPWAEAMAWGEKPL